MRALGLDVGIKTIGVAVSDGLGLAAHPLDTLERRGERHDVARVVEIARAEEAEAIVVGMPLELSGDVGRRARRVGRFVTALRQDLDGALPVHEWDERFSTVAVERILLDADLSRRRRKQVVDKQAAAYILQGWLDARREGTVE